MISHRHIFIGSFAAATLLIAVQGAMACTVIPFERSSVIRGEHCAIEYRDRGKIGTVGLQAAEDLGSAVVFQRFFGQFDSMIIVSDCTSGQALILGPLDVPSGICDIMTDAEDTAFDAAVAAAPLTKAEQKIRRDGPLGRVDLDALLAEFRPQVNEATIVALKNRIKISASEEKPRHWFDLGCGCKFYYPDSAGAKS